MLLFLHIPNPVFIVCSLDFVTTFLAIPSALISAPNLHIPFYQAWAAAPIITPFLLTHVPLRLLTYTSHRPCLCCGHCAFWHRTILLPTPYCDHMCEFISLQFIFHTLYTKPVLFRFDSLFGNTPSVVSTILIFLLLVKFFIVIVIILSWLLLQFVLFLHVAYT